MVGAAAITLRLEAGKPAGTVAHRALLGDEPSWCHLMDDHTVAGGVQRPDLPLRQDAVDRPAAVTCGAHGRYLTLVAAHVGGPRIRPGPSQVVQSVLCAPPPLLDDTCTTSPYVGQT